MTNRDIYKFAKKALKTPWLYNDKELSYMRKAAKAAKMGMKLEEMTNGGLIDE